MSNLNRFGSLDLDLDRPHTWTPHRSRNPGKAGKMIQSLRRQEQNGATLEDVGERAWRLLRMTHAHDQLNGQTNDVRARLGLLPLPDEVPSYENGMPIPTSTEHYTTKLDYPGDFPSTENARRLMDEVHREYMAALQGKKFQREIAYDADAEVERHMASYEELEPIFDAKRSISLI